MNLKLNEEIFALDPEKYVMLSNSSSIYKKFHNQDNKLNVKYPQVYLTGGLGTNTEFEKQFRSKYRKNWLKDPTSFCYVRDLQLLVGFFKVSDLRARLKNPKTKLPPIPMKTIFDLAIEIFTSPLPTKHEFFSMDESFLQIVNHLRNPYILKEMLRIPHSSVEQFSGKGVDVEKLRNLFGKAAAIQIHTPGATGRYHTMVASGGSSGSFFLQEADENMVDRKNCPQAVILGKVEKASLKAAIIARQGFSKPKKEPGKH
jgi:hypothetical protein